MVLFSLLLIIFTQHLYHFYQTAVVFIESTFHGYSLIFF